MSGSEELICLILKNSSLKIFTPADMSARDNWCSPGSSAAISSIAVSSTLGSSNPVSSTTMFLIGLFDHLFRIPCYTMLYLAMGPPLNTLPLLEQNIGILVASIKQASCSTFGLE